MALATQPSGEWKPMKIVGAPDVIFEEPHEKDVSWECCELGSWKKWVRFFWVHKSFQPQCDSKNLGDQQSGAFSS